jgi:hypothetical protein
MRAASTVVDTGVFLLLVAGAVVTLTSPLGPLPGPGDDAADETADVLATNTHDVSYSLAPAEGGRSSVVSFPRTDGRAFQRTAHGTLAGHLAAAAVANLTMWNHSVTGPRADYVRSVAAVTRNLTRSRDHLAQVRAVWQPYEGAPVRGEVTVGPTPPPDQDVHVATMVVSSGFPATEAAATKRAREGNVTGVGRTVATNVVEGLFPPEETRSALVSGYPDAQLVTYRYERVGAIAGVNVTSYALADDPDAANDRLADRLGAAFAADMAARFDSPERAASTVSVDRVRFTVRTWSP